MPGVLIVFLFVSIVSPPTIMPVELCQSPKVQNCSAQFLYLVLPTKKRPILQNVLLLCLLATWHATVYYHFATTSNSFSRSRRPKRMHCTEKTNTRISYTLHCIISISPLLLICYLPTTVHKCYYSSPSPCVCTILTTSGCSYKTKINHQID